MPSILELCDVPIPESVQGHSVVPLLKQADSPFRTHLCGDGLGCFAVTDGKTKYMWYSDDDLEFFFDTQNDPSESHDLLDDPAWQDQVEEARNRLIAWMSANNDPACKDGKLIAQANYSPDIEGHRTSTGWNNRGRH